MSKSLRDPVVIHLLGDKGVGRSTFIRSLAGPDYYTTRRRLASFSSSSSSGSDDDEDNLDDKDAAPGHVSLSMYTSYGVVTVHLHETPNGLFEGPLRSELYLDADAVLLMAAADMPDSLESVGQQWYHDLLRNIPECRRFLILSKAHLQADKAVIDRLARRYRRPVTLEACQELATAKGFTTTLEWDKNMLDDRFAFLKPVVEYVLHDRRHGRPSDKHQDTGKCVVL
ncbi:hypothetical protein H696_05700 [Fonticula alba]|uniref:Uncharacterized protein n=1 Tax=Fonticula alba TaxID=691883 RepID=A0A058Z1E2_FONAL|nr:hypothetical protein H696_05700 [Fonticula alba]KCV67758.1 hypothetical protein H696_05700 [Fonticula alba]|eukprot:XP_009497789.1 hypothetical protein H696_05700 [Fonticula alba]